MSNGSCPLEYDVVAATRSDRWTDRLRLHTETCPHCQSTVLVATMMQQAAMRTRSEIEVAVSYRVPWWKAQCIRKQERLSRLDRLMLIGVFVAAAMVLAGFALWKWSLVQRWLAGVSGEPGSSLPLYLLAGCAALVWFLTEEVFAGEK